jgi:hypothetical protein
MGGASFIKDREACAERHKTFSANHVPPIQGYNLHPALVQSDKNASQQC